MIDFLDFWKRRVERHLVIRLMLTVLGFLLVSEGADAAKCLPESEFAQHQKNLYSHVHEIRREDGAIVSLYLFEDSSDPLQMFEKFLEVIRKGGGCILSVSFLNRQQLDERYKIFASWSELVEGASGDNEGLTEGEAEEFTEADVSRYTLPDHFRIPKVYAGPSRRPDFKGRDKDFALFKTRISDAMKQGVTFAGEYSVAQFGCGTGCTRVVVANNRTGQLYGFPRGGEFNQALTLEFEPTSKLMLARWYTDSLWETCVIEALVFEEGKWLAEEAIAGKGDEVCEGGVAAGAAKARGY